MKEERLRRLARRLSSLAQQDAARTRRATEIAALRRRAACELYELCAALVSELNALAEGVQLVLSPETFDAQSFHDEQLNLFQIQVNGRIVQISFECTDTLTSSEQIAQPYTLYGSVRWFNQDMIERDEVQEHQLFYVVDQRDRGWRWYDPMLHRIGVFDDEYLGGLIDALI